MGEPYRLYFENEVPSAFNPLHETLVSRAFHDLDPRRNKSHDFVCGEWRIESKLIRAIASSTELPRGIKDGSVARAMAYVAANRSILSRSLRVDAESHTSGFNRKGESRRIGNQSVQQVKVGRFDYLLLDVVFMDRMRFYLVPAGDIAEKVQSDRKGKIHLSPQHGNDYEGIIGLGHITDYLILETDDPMSKLESGKFRLAPFLRRKLRRCG